MSTRHLKMDTQSTYGGLSRMKAFFNKRISRLHKAESGFTLVELLVVVAIIIALAAVIIPSVAAFASKGDDGAKAAERDNVQTAMDTYMADIGSTTVAGNILSTQTSTNDFSSGGVVDLSTYLRKDTTEFFYCWDISGLVFEQNDTGANCSV